MVIKLYGATTTNYNVQRAILPLFEAEVDIDNVLELKPVDLFKGEQKRPEYLAKQPFGQVPCIEDGDFILFESRAIARYLAEMYGHDQLLGKTLKERVSINQWMEVESQNFASAVSAMIRELFVSILRNRPLDEVILAAGVAKLKLLFDVYEVQLSKHKYIAGDEYSLADAVHTPSLNVLMRIKERVFTADHPHVLTWAEDLIARPAFQKVVKLDAKWSEQQAS